MLLYSRRMLGHVRVCWRWWRWLLLLSRRMLRVGVCGQRRWLLLLWVLPMMLVLPCFWPLHTGTVRWRQMAEGTLIPERIGPVLRLRRWPAPTAWARALRSAESVTLCHVLLFLPLLFLFLTLVMLILLPPAGQLFLLSNQLLVLLRQLLPHFRPVSIWLQWHMNHKVRKDRMHGHWTPKPPKTDDVRRLCKVAGWAVHAKHTSRYHQPLQPPKSPAATDRT